ncbi:MAG TPA: hypothetical protein VKE71_00685 [Candidatus Angelobacter sp.]|nr:hypothetical protein [Candidatus Angelobacter sp.]
METNPLPAFGFARDCFECVYYCPVLNDAYYGTATYKRIRLTDDFGRAEIQYTPSSEIATTGREQTRIQ